MMMIMIWKHLLVPIPNWFAWSSHDDDDDDNDDNDDDIYMLIMNDNVDNVW